MRRFNLSKVQKEEGRWEEEDTRNRATPPTPRNKTDLEALRVWLKTSRCHSEFQEKKSLLFIYVVADAGALTSYIILPAAECHINRTETWIWETRRRRFLTRDGTRWHFVFGFCSFTDGRREQRWLPLHRSAGKRLDSHRLALSSTS